ncbi:MAG TPA: SOS response-associated peptidase family protein [Rhizomicrobium sp.]|jgi:putative SOS response-associated peptidase YedK|nr:SOS response-associated peptidase family protein [Rhizomicrobium sp.]
MKPTWGMAAKLEGLRPPKAKWKQGSNPLIGSVAECIAKWLELPGYQQRDCWIAWGYPWAGEAHGRMQGEAIAAYVLEYGIPPHMALQRGQPPLERLREIVSMPRLNPAPMLGPDEKWLSIGDDLENQDDDGMCGKFTAMASWAEVVAFSQPLTVDRYDGANDQSRTYRVMTVLPVIIWDKDLQRRRVVPMRWGWPDPWNWRSPKPIHARAETIDDPRKTFAKPFYGGQRGIVIVKTFNEAPDVPGKAEQHTITPGDRTAMGFAFVWKSFEIEGLPQPLLACVMVTVPANKLIATLPTDRMPAILANEDWATWLGENDAGPAEAKACLKTVEGVNWKMTKEERESSVRAKPTVSDPGGRQ